MIHQSSFINMRPYLLVTLLLIVGNTYGQEDLPEWASKRLKNLISNKFELTKDPQPGYLISDFTGDGKEDVAFFILNKVNNKKGIVIFYSIENQDMHFITGAGNSKFFDDFHWVDEWSIFDEPKTWKTTFKEDGDIDGNEDVILNNTAIYLKSNDEVGGGGLIYYDGKEWTWIHQGS